MIRVRTTDFHFHCAHKKLENIHFEMVALLY